jgi:hypothetical protein
MSYSLLAKETEIKIHRIVILPVLLYGCAASSHVEKRTQTEGVQEYGTEEDI